MRAQTTLGQAAEAIRQKSKDHWDDTFPADVIRFENLNRVEIDHQGYLMMESAQRLVASRLKIPFEYLKRCPSHLQQINLNHWIDELGNTRLFLRFDGARLRAMFTTRYRVINNTEILDRMFECGFTESEEVFLTFSNEIMVLNMPSHDRTFGLMNEKITPGISFVNSEVGISSFSVQAFFLRLICTNGLILAEITQNKIRHIRENALEDLMALVDQAGAMAEQNREKMRIAADRRVDNPISTIESFNRQFRIKKETGELVKEAWQREPVYTLWGVINAYTRASQDSGISAETAYRFEQIGGLVLNLVKK